MDNIFEGYIFVIDTNKYSGNFERNMCAYMTGVIGECEVGEEWAEIAREELSTEMVEFFDKDVYQVPDEFGVCRPVSIWDTPGYFNDGSGNHWPDGTDDKVVREKYIESRKKFLLPIIKRGKKCVEEDPVKYDYLRKVINGHLKLLEDAKTKELVKWAAYQSVAIFFYREPTEDIINLLKDRSKKYANHYNDRLVIEGFRLLKSEVIEVRKL